MSSIRVLVGSVFGGALLTARELKKVLEPEGHGVVVCEQPTLSDITDNDDPILICTSTTGQGEVPPNLLPFYLELRDTLPQQPGRPFGVIVLGDSSYGDTYCGAGDLMEEAFLETSARKVGETLKIDALETTEPEKVAVTWVENWLTKVS
ncbi:flavodoxin [Marinobacter sp. CHS3-4]|uniref:flavodoxin n=1 Tax=Marinobacter sp. CHS3-4 TaxID=3045174 RepID=UPI0024B5D092|nr:flavodoxin [Marinobacter sp. CHS3-4]MDI9244096.1 flavodoxin [Marinobacter sp. CHS3-4]